MRCSQTGNVGRNGLPRVEEKEGVFFMVRVWLRLGLVNLLLLSGGCVFPWASPQVESAVSSAPAPSEDEAVAAPRVSVRARELLEQARTLWNAQDACVQPDAAAAWLDAALQVQPDYAEALLWRGRALTESGYLEDAFDDFTRSIRLQPTALAYACRGLVGLRLGSLQGAERDLETAIRLDAGEPRAYVYRSALRFMQEQPKQACADLSAACARGLCAPRENAARDGLCP